MAMAVKDTASIVPGGSDVLLVTDVQNDFCPGGALAVPEGDAIVPLINRLATRFAHVVLTQDWHPEGHVSFASAHPGKEPYDAIELPYGPQTLWPDHCVQESLGAAFHPDLDVPRSQLIVRKGYHPTIDSYSAFYERGLRHVYLVGLATDYCVRYSAIDARREGFEATVLLAACRAIDLDGSLRQALDEMAASGVALVSG
jgi:nicotinamidase-related amidase